jgi:hypothetical protein
MSLHAQPLSVHSSGSAVASPAPAAPRLRSLSASNVLRAALLVACSVVARPASAQGAGFQAGELFIYSAAAQGISSTSGAILRCDPLTGATSEFVDLFFSQQQPGAAVYDPYRQRVVLSAGLFSVSDPLKLWFADGTGVVQDSGAGSLQWHSMAPTGDGRIYARDVNSFTGAFKYLDAAGAVHVLMDAAGAAPFAIDGLPTFDARGMIYEAGTNALFTTSNQTCAGGVAGRINVIKLPLSADGARVAGPVTCAQFEVSTSGETPAGISRMPGGSLLVGVDSNSNSAEPRLLTVDPVTLAITPFATNGSYIGAAASNAACWSSALGKAVILDTFVDTLRAFAAGSTGEGTLIATSIPLSSGGSSGETPAIFEVAADPCAGGWIGYGAGLAGAGGIVPTLTGAGCPEPGSAITISMGSIVGGASGVMFLGLAPGALPFKGGTVHLAGVLLTFPLAVGGAPGIAGAGSLVLPVVVPANPALPGLSVFLQNGWSDGAAVKDVSLSNGLQIQFG